MFDGDVRFATVLLVRPSIGDIAENDRVLLGAVLRGELPFALEHGILILQNEHFRLETLDFVAHSLGLICKDKRAPD